MKSLKEIKNDLLALAATHRLEELNKEKELLIRLIEGAANHNLKKSIKKTTKLIKRSKRKYKKGFKYTKSNPHWMQKPENRARVIAMAKKRAAKRAQL